MDPFYPAPREWGKSSFNDLLRATEAPLPEPQVWVDSRGQIVLDVYVNWEQRETIVHVDVKTKREGENGFIFRRVKSYRGRKEWTKAERATALRAYGDMEAMKMGMPWRPRGKL